MFSRCLTLKVNPLRSGGLRGTHCAPQFCQQLARTAQTKPIFPSLPLFPHMQNEDKPVHLHW